MITLKLRAGEARLLRIENVKENKTNNKSL